MLTVMVGALVQWEHGEAAVLLTALTMVLLGNKRPVHEWTNAFTHTDIRATLQFVAITGVILPLVPDRDFGPFDGFNPQSTWMMVVLISGVGFTGYVLMRIFNTRAGIAITSLFGGIASSTATTLAFSRRSREDAKHPRDYVMAIAIASTVMLPRVLVILAFVNRELTVLLLWPFALMAVPGIAFAALMWWQERGKRRKADLPSVSNPLNLSAALKFAAIFAVISFIVKAAQQTGHLQTSLLPLSFVSGLTDMEAISLSLGRNFHGDGLALAAKGVILAAVANSIMKGVLAAVIASKGVRWPIAIMMGITSACGVTGMFLVGEGGGDTQPPPTVN
jgi:uncharacterized membrane protein (DUF4010 family)